MGLPAPQHDESPSAFYDGLFASDITSKLFPQASGASRLLPVQLRPLCVAQVEKSDWLKYKRFLTKRIEIQIHWDKVCPPYAGLHCGLYSFLYLLRDTRTPSRPCTPPSLTQPVAGIS